MAVYTHLTNEEIAALLTDDYDVGALKFALGIAEGVENSNYLVEAVKNGATTKYILTLFERRVNVAELPFYLGLMQHLAMRGFAAPEPVMRRDGTLYGAYQNKAAAMVSFLSGKSRSEATHAHCHEVGKALATLHKAGEGFVRSRSNSMGLAAWQMLQQKTAARVDEISPGLASFIEKEMAFLLQAWPQQISTLPQGVIHADLFPDNVFFEGDRVSGVIDFYFACNDALLYDLAIAINAWCFSPAHAFEPEKAYQMMAGYETVRAITPAEKRAMPLMLRGAAMRFLLSRAHDWLFRDAGAIVKVKDPMEYAAKLKFHQHHAGGRHA